MLHASLRPSEVLEKYIYLLHHCELLRKLRVMGSSHGSWPRDCEQCVWTSESNLGMQTDSVAWTAGTQGQWGLISGTCD